MASRSRTTLLALALALAAAGCGSEEEQNEPLPAAPPGDARLIGEVLENDRGCSLDRECALRVRTDDGEVRVVYHYGEAPPCRNTKAIQAGSRAEEGDRVEVLGRRRSAAEVATCDDASYFIRPA